MYFRRSFLYTKYNAFEEMAGPLWKYDEQDSVLQRCAPSATRGENSVIVGTGFTQQEPEQSSSMKCPSPEPDELQSSVDSGRLLRPAFGSPSSLHLCADL